MRKFIEESWLVIVLGIGIAVGLGATQAALSDSIAANRKAALEKAIFDVVPGTVKTEPRQVAQYDVYRCLDEAGTAIGWAVSASGFGFQDKISLVIGLSPDGAKILGLYVLDQKETPGLGNRVEEDDWRGQFKGMDATAEVQAIKNEPKDRAHEVQAVTGATITSVAVTKIVNGVISKVCPQLQGLN